MERLANTVGRLRGWRRAVVALLLGALATLALPPFHIVPVLIPAFTGLLWMIGASRNHWSAAAVGWWFGFGHFLAGLYWVAIAFSVAGVALWAAPVAVHALAGVAALYPAVVAALTQLGGAEGVRGVVVFALLWTVGEWARGVLVMGGFPWNLIGYGWAFSEAMIQFAALTGVLGLSLITVLAAAMPAALATATGAAPARRAPAWRGLAIVALVLAAIWAGGALRLAGASSDQVAGVRLRIVQANIAQHHKWREDLRADHLARHLELSASPAPVPISHLIWPETASPYVLQRDPQALAALAAAAPAGGLLITGAIRTTPPDGTPFRIWNSLHAIDAGGAIRGTYDKFHLVPFGEYVPLRAVLAVAKLTVGEVDFSRGPGPRTLHLDGLPGVSPLICYEAIFGGRVADTDDRPGWLLNVTNDAWYGTSTGPYQHMAQARLRTVEEGLPLVRAANTGISAVVDAYGRVIARLGLGEAGVLDAPLPTALSGRTLYNRYGDLPLGLVIVALGAWAWRFGRR